MSVAAFDTETRAMSPGRQVEDLACLSVCVDGREPQLYGRRDAAAAIRSLLLRPDVTLTAHNLAFDVLVLVEHDLSLWPLFRAAYEADRMTCTQRRAELLDIARVGRVQEGRYSLDAQCQALGIHLDKSEDSWRLRYGDLIPIPIEQWPEPAKLYPKLDAWACWKLYESQEKDADRFLRDQFRQARGSLPIHAMGSWGIRCDPLFVRAHEHVTKEAYARVSGIVRDAGILRPDHMLRSGPRKGQIEPGTLNMKALRARVADAYAKIGERPDTTDGGAIATDKLALRKSGDWVLRAEAERASLRKILSEELPIMRRGCVEDVHPYHRALVVSGRKGCKNPNLDNRPNRFGAREAFAPRNGYVFASCDYGGLENATLAECCMALFGTSALCEKLKRGIDCHSEFGAGVLGISYEDAMRRKENKDDKEMWRARQVGKVFNFGKPGGLGIGSLIDFADRQYQVQLTIEESRRFSELWFRTYPEMRRYFGTIDAHLKRSGGTMVQIYTDRVRGRCGYTDACNTLFQGMGADIFKQAMWDFFCESMDQFSPLFGARLVLAPHDDMIPEIPETRGWEGALRLKEIMDVAAARFMKHTPLFGGKPAIMDHWCKDAESPNGELYRLIEHPPKNVNPELFRRLAT